MAQQMGAQPEAEPLVAQVAQQAEVFGTEPDGVVARLGTEHE